MIDGILLFLVILVFYSFWWFDFYFFKKNTLRFKKDFDEALKEADAIIIFNAGGWGTIRNEEAFDLNPFSEFIKNYLKEKGLKVSVVQYFRTEDHLIGKIGYLKDYFLNFKKQAKSIISIISKNNKKVILLGLSNGALIADEVMERIENEKNIFSVELGKPFFGINSKNENILSINECEDDLSNGHTIELLKATFIFGPLRWIKNFVLGEGISLGKAVRIRGHNYPLQKYENQLVDFIDKKII